jgi:hypothetical protein
MCPGVDSASKNEYQVNPGGKSGRCVTLTTLPQSCAVVMKSGNLNFLETSGPLQVSNGTALLLSLLHLWLAVNGYLKDFLKKGGGALTDWN